MSSLAICADDRMMLPGIYARRRKLLLSSIALLMVTAILSACGGRALAPIGRAPPRNTPIKATPSVSTARMHRVVRGDSLYSIAWNQALDYRDLSRWNAIAEPYTIYPGQYLRLYKPAAMPRAAVKAPLASRSANMSTKKNTKATNHRRPTIKKPGKATKATTKPRIKKPVVAAKSSRRLADNQASDAAVRRWQWPVKGRVIGSFSKAGGKGIDIAGSRGRAIKAAASGQVVYSGSGLRGYGMLIIVKHNKRYLSAYAHNERLHVKEGDTVKGGQRIADMGDSGAKSVRLHFEIRRDGKPVDPTRFLPK